MRKEQERGGHGRANRCSGRSSKLGVTLRPAPGPHRRRNAARNDRAPFQPAFEIDSQSACGAIARLRLALQTARADCLQIAIERGYERAQFRRRFFAGLLNHGQSVFAQERRAPGEQIEQDCSEAVNVGSRSKLGCRSFGLLGCDVTRRAEDCECAREIGTGVEPFGQAEIRYEWFALTVKQDVSWLEIAMQNAVLMRVLHSAPHLGRKSYAFAQFVAQSRPSCLQASPSGVFHTEEGQAVFRMKYATGGSLQTA